MDRTGEERVSVFKVVYLPSIYSCQFWADANNIQCQNLLLSQTWMCVRWMAKKRPRLLTYHQKNWRVGQRHQTSNTANWQTQYIKRRNLPKYHKLIQSNGQLDMQYETGDHRDASRMAFSLFKMSFKEKTSMGSSENWCCDSEKIMY